MDKPVSMAARRRSMTGARSRAEGLGFEYLIDNACAYYLSRDIADIEKTPEPMKPLGNADRAGRFLACFTKKAQPDYSGLLNGGRAIKFEAKHTDSDRITQDRVSNAQSLRLASTERLGGVAFVPLLFRLKSVLPRSVGCLARYERILWPEVYHPGGRRNLPRKIRRAGSTAFFGGGSIRNPGEEIIWSGKFPS